MELQPHAVPFVTATDLTEHAERLLDPACVYLSVENYLILNLDPDGTSIEFRRIVIDAGARGIGQPVIRHMESFCRSELGASRVWLDVYHDNERARHVYEKLGFSRFREQNFGGRLLIYYQKRL